MDFHKYAAGGFLSDLCIASSTYGSGIDAGGGEPVAGFEGSMAVVDGGEVMVNPPAWEMFGICTSRY